MESTLLANVIEQRRGRRWGIFFKLLGFGYIFIIFTIASLQLDVFSKLGGIGGDGSQGNSHTALISLKGTIASDSDASSENLINSLRQAFEDTDTAAIILEINSGGGSPVQSGYVYDEIKRLRTKYPDTKVYAVITDMGASGAYYIAAAADAIYADKASLVGSIGVTAASFGFVDTLQKLGVERRIYTSGAHKAFLDPFQPMNAAETAFWKTQLATVHQQFINVVRAGRGNRLKETPEMFSGLIWSGEKALDMGLVDGLGSARYVAREVIKTPKLKNFTFRDSPMNRLVRRLGTSIGDRLALDMGANPALQ